MQDVMSGLDQADVVPQIFFPHNAGKIDIREIQR